MADETVQPDAGSPAGAAGGIELDPAQQAYLQQKIESEQNLVMGVVAGLAASILGAVAWAAITYFTNFQIGFMAVGIGYLVGYAVRASGKGVSRSFGIAGALLALFGCLLGNLLTVIAVVANQLGISLTAVTENLDARSALELMWVTSSPIDLLFYGIAVYEGYRLSFRQLDGRELQDILTGVGGAPARPPQPPVR